jgi:hypothetical protein
MTLTKRLEIIKHKEMKYMKISEFRYWLHLDKYGNKSDSIDLEYVNDLAVFLAKGDYNDHLIFLEAIIKKGKGITPCPN